MSIDLQGWSERVRHSAYVFPAAVLAAFAASGVPLVRLAWRLDRPVAPYVPVMLALRAGGVLAGVAGALLSRRLTVGAPTAEKPPAR